jgi:hypothetical protein
MVSSARRLSGDHSHRDHADVFPAPPSSGVKATTIYLRKSNLDQKVPGT